MRTSLELVVIAIILLITAVVVLGIFTGGIQNFTSIFNTQSDQQIKTSLCMSACANYCMLHPQTDPSKPHEFGWGGTDGVPDPLYKGTAVGCSTIYSGGKCVCSG